LGDLVLAFGAAVLLIVAVVLINVAAIVTFGYLGYRSDENQLLMPSNGVRVAEQVVLLLVVGGVLFGTTVQLSFERGAASVVDNVLQRPVYDALDAVAVRTSYDSLSESRTVTVTVSRTSNRSYPHLAREIKGRITQRTGRSPEVRVRYQDYQVVESGSTYPSNGSSGS
jgi:uncharacterized membrane protein